MKMIEKFFLGVMTKSVCYDWMKKGGKYMKKKTIIFSIICIFILAAFSGCTKQNAITNSKFEEKAKEKGFTVGDATAQYESYDYIKTATVAQSPDAVSYTHLRAHET